MRRILFPRSDLFELIVDCRYRYSFPAARERLSISNIFSAAMRVGCSFVRTDVALRGRRFPLWVEGFFDAIDILLKLSRDPQLLLGRVRCPTNSGVVRPLDNDGEGILCEVALLGLRVLSILRCVFEAREDDDAVCRKYSGVD